MQGHIQSFSLAIDWCYYTKSAWNMMQRIKEVCGNRGFVLGSVVEIDETYTAARKVTSTNTNKYLDRTGPEAENKQ